MTDEQRTKFENLGSYHVLLGVMALVLTKRAKNTNNMIIPVMPYQSMNYNDILPAIEFLQTAITNNQTHELLDALALASFDVMYPEQK
jgi:hypothetical protein